MNDHFTGVLVVKLGIARCTSALQFFVVLHDMWAWRCTWTTCTVSAQINSGEVQGELGCAHPLPRWLCSSRWFGVRSLERLPHVCRRCDYHGRKYLNAMLELLGLEGAKDVPKPCAPAHKEQLVTRDLLGLAEIAVYRQCFGGLLCYTQDRADAQFEVSIFGSMVGKPTACSMPALKRVARYLQGTREFVNELELDQEVDKHEVKLDGFSDSDWAGSTEVAAKRCALHRWRALLSRRQSVTATSSRMAEFYAGCATVVEMLLERDVLSLFGFRVEAVFYKDSAAARGICRREGVVKVNALEVRILWLQQVVKAKTFMLKTVKSVDNCADLETTTWGGWYVELSQEHEWVGQEAYDKRGITDGGSCDDLVWGNS